MISVGFFAQDASFPVSWLPAEQQQLDTSGELFEFTGTIFSSFTAVSGILQTHTGFSTYLSALVDQTVLKLDAPADATSGTEFAVMTLAPQQTFATASEALIAAAVFSGTGLTEVNLGNGGQDGCAATCANTYNACRQQQGSFVTDRSRPAATGILPASEPAASPEVPSVLLAD